MDARTGFETVADAYQATEDRQQWLRSSHVPLACLVLLLSLHFSLALTRTINWDEFHFLSRVHDFARGELSLPLQTLHVRLFHWLTNLDLLGVDQILRARLVMFACLLGTTGAIYLTARRFAEAPAAWLCALAYLACGYVLQHGTSFRFDPIVAFLNMSALAILARSSLRWFWLLGTALLLAMAALVSIKMVLYLPAFAGIAWLRWADRGYSASPALRIAGALLLTVLFAGVLFVLHRSGLAEPEPAERIVSRAGGAMFGISPFIHFTTRGALFALPTFALILFSISALSRQFHRERAEVLALAGLMLPIVALVFYRNLFPYFHAFILPPVCVATVAAIKLASERYGAAPIAVIFALWGCLIWQGEEQYYVDRQRQLQAAVNTMFPEPVHYFDFPGFLPDHKKANFFMSSWGVFDYRRGVFPSFEEVMDLKPVPLVAALEPQWNPTMSGTLYDNSATNSMLKDDVAAIRDTYRPVWGPFWVAGVELEHGEARQWRVRVPGLYTVQGDMTVNGMVYSDGDTLTLDRGVADLVNRDKDSVGLLFGDNLKLPDEPPPPRPYWTDF
ncbi:hypothetical protein GRI69_14270 [Erythrobacter vulgaris]|uniref:Glycosyltransferase RgtA/B/C/D-like domain-containing protein n=1 Tax=Qipengyuania vulgaris TaxID=291985 RepID=A0A844XWV3_9SPHN|nr:hypothetical protein [Qipengyuania vulgaris]MXO49418.1 hypothetical protein [Qipengyuania vulgaris]